MQHARIFRYLQNDSNAAHFSLHDWVNDESRRGLIFLTTRTKQRESLKGLMALFINSLSNEILSLHDNPERRIFLFIDEFGVLPPMHAVKELLTLGRSKGCSFWIGIQEKAQLNEVYGDNVANTIVNQCNTYAIFRMNDPRSADYFSLLFGESESESMESSYSSAARDRRETETYRSATKTARLVLPAEIHELANLHYYLKIHSHPVTRSLSTYRAYPEMAPVFLANLDYQLGKTGNNNRSHETRSNKGPDSGNQNGAPAAGPKPQFSMDDFDF